MLLGLLWGASWLFFRVTGLPAPEGVFEPAPPAPNAVLDVLTTVMGAVGVLQGIGTLKRAPWGLAAAVTWFTLLALFGWVLLGSYAEEASAADVVGALLNTAMFGAFALYYRNRREWFGLPPTKEPALARGVHDDPK
jgi:hypothetical protein